MREVARSSPKMSEHTPAKSQFATILPLARTAGYVTISSLKT
jgi:hypothetical protein